MQAFNLLDKMRLRLGRNGTLNLLHNSAEGKNTMVLDKKAQLYRPKNVLCRVTRRVMRV